MSYLPTSPISWSGARGVNDIAVPLVVYGKGLYLAVCELTGTTEVRECTGTGVRSRTRWCSVLNVSLRHDLDGL